MARHADEAIGWVNTTDREPTLTGKNTKPVRGPTIKVVREAVKWPSQRSALEQEAPRFEYTPGFIH